MDYIIQSFPLISVHCFLPCLPNALQSTEYFTHPTGQASIGLHLLQAGAMAIAQLYDEGTSGIFGVTGNFKEIWCWGKKRAYFSHWGTLNN